MEIFSFGNPIVANDYDVDTLDLNVLEMGLIDLHYIVWKIFEKLNFFSKYSIPLDVYQEFIFNLERKYNKRKNPFHNFYHGVTGKQI